MLCSPLAEENKGSIRYPYKSLKRDFSGKLTRSRFKALHFKLCFIIKINFNRIKMPIKHKIQFSVQGSIFYSRLRVCRNVFVFLVRMSLLISWRQTVNACQTHDTKTITSCLQGNSNAPIFPKALLNEQSFA